MSSNVEVNYTLLTLVEVFCSMRYPQYIILCVCVETDNVDVLQLTVLVQ